MASFYHVSTSWIDRPDMAFAREGDGRSTHGLGFYATRDAGYASEHFARRDNGEGNGALYRLDLDDSATLEAYAPVDRAFVDRLVAAAGETGAVELNKGLAEAVHRMDQGEQVMGFELLRVLGESLPDQRRENEVLRAAGVGVVLKDENVCVIDTDLVKNMTLEKVLGDGPKGMPLWAAEGQPTVRAGDPSVADMWGARDFRSENLENAARSVAMTTDPEIKRAFERVTKGLLSEEITAKPGRPPENLQHFGFEMRDGVGRAILASLQRTNELDSTSSEAPFARALNNLKENLGADHPLVKEVGVLGRALDRHVEERNRPVVLAESQVVAAMPPALRQGVGATQSLSDKTLTAAVGQYVSLADKMGAGTENRPQFSKEIGQTLLRSLSGDGEASKNLKVFLDGMKGAGAERLVLLAKAIGDRARAVLDEPSRQALRGPLIGEPQVDHARRAGQEFGRVLAGLKAVVATPTRAQSGGDAR